VRGAVGLKPLVGGGEELKDNKEVKIINHQKINPNVLCKAACAYCLVPQKAGTDAQKTGTLHAL
jgi:sulfatase maturation enzyme AslB (radical SAM superfamily)